MRTKFDQNELDKMRGDPDNYKWGIFYFNPQDPRTIVLKRIPAMGLTLNFARPYSYLFIIGILLFAILMGRLENS